MHAFSFLFCHDYCAFYSLGIGRTDLIYIALSTVLLIVVDYYAYASIPLPKIVERRTVRWSAYYVFALWFLIAGYFVPQTFIYFQF